MLLTVQVASRLSDALREAGQARLAGVARLPGNPLRVKTRSFGSAVCDLVDSDVGHYHYFSGPRRLDENSDVAAMAAWYRERSRRLYVRLSPLEAPEQLLRMLAQAGLQQTGFMSTLFGATEAWPAQAAVGEDARAFARLWTDDVSLQPIIEAEFSRGWHSCVARVDGEPAAYGALFVATNAVGVCAAAATSPPYRGRGLQTALLRQRITLAAQNGCDLIVAQASPGSTSQRNMQRLGLALAYTSVTWTW